MPSATRQIKVLKRHQRIQAAELGRHVRRAREDLAVKIHKAAASGKVASNAFQTRFFNQDVKGVYDILDRDLAKWGHDLTSGVATRWHKEALVDVKDSVKGSVKSSVLKFDRKRVRDYWQLMTPGNSQHVAAVFTNNMQKETVASLRKVTIDTFRQGQLAGWNARRLNQELQSGWDKLAGDMASHRFIDAAGRPWSNARYFQMLIRTTTARVARESYFDTLVSNGDDLAMVRNVGDTCPICRAWDGVIVSITGNSPDFPAYQAAVNAGVYHPNCDCLAQRVDETVHADHIQKQKGRATPSEVDNLGRPLTSEERKAANQAMQDYRKATGAVTGPHVSAGSGPDHDPGIEPGAGKKATRKKAVKKKVGGKAAGKKKGTGGKAIAKKPAKKAPGKAQKQAKPKGQAWTPTSTTKDAQAQLQAQLDASAKARADKKLPGYVQESGGPVTGPAVRFWHEPTQGEIAAGHTTVHRGHRILKPDAVRARRYDVAILDEMSPEVAEVVGEVMQDLNKEADLLGLPRLRSVHTVGGDSANASMGDGILFINPRNFEERLGWGGRVEIDRGIKSAESSVAFFEQKVKNMERAARMNAAQLKEGLAQYGDTAVDAIADLKKNDAWAKVEVTKAKRNLEQAKNRLATAKARQPGNVDPHPWTRGKHDVEDRPYHGYRYATSGKDACRSTMWHEFGHHIHQQMGAYTRSEYVGMDGYAVPGLKESATPLEIAVFKAWKAAGRKHKGSFRDSPGSATGYSAANHKEWFAENYSLEKMGRHDLVDEGFQPILDKLEQAKKESR